jgi:ABC-type transport system involved in cytochrome bd biosynthesis fused ATPase/permease subunit
LVPDDATAAIDPETEDLIRRGMKHVMRDRTTFLIAHRISSVKKADLVIVLEEGQVTQSGTHDELMQTDGHYREIAGAQLHGDDEEEADPEANPSHIKRMRDEKLVADVAVAARDGDEKI